MYAGHAVNSTFPDATQMCQSLLSDNWSKGRDVRRWSERRKKEPDTVMERYGWKEEEEMSAVVYLYVCVNVRLYVLYE